MIIKTLPVAIALALAATASQAQQAMDHPDTPGTLRQRTTARWILGRWITAR